jgi:hypothetical protein
LRDIGNLADDEAGFDKNDELRYLSKVIKLGAVEEFNFEFAD